jgi:hypothetical protein
MKASFENFMTGLIDYAGLFPPASLDIETVLRKYAGYLESEDGWMLGRCVVPATQLHRVVLHPGFRCSVIVSPGVSREEFDRLSAFTGRVEMLETRLANTAGSPGLVLDQLLHLKTRFDQAGLRGVKLFVETESAAPAAAAIAAFNSRGSGGEAIKSVGYKLRCGGLEKQAFPAPEQVAEAIGLCRGHDIAIKFTAGMHQPFRHFSADSGVMQHGFINIFAAALMCWGCNLSFDETVQCLGDETAHHFHFTEEGFSWQDKTISANEMRSLRKNKVISFGSCSFTEPVEDLRLLGVLGNKGS